jgi:hypothetical protein
MRQFLIGSVIGALLMYAAIHLVPEWKASSENWMEKAASGYRGDSEHQRAREALR